MKQQTSLQYELYFVSTAYKYSVTDVETARIKICWLYKEKLFEAMPNKI